MGKGKVGLKLADGKFYPVLEDGGASRKRLVVTTVQDGQRSVQIDLYRGEGPSVEGSEYIGSLVIEGVPPMAKGQPDIRMEVSLDESQTLSAYAEEASTGASQSLKVSLKSLSDEEKYEIPDFEFASAEPRTAPESSFADEDFADTDQLPSEQASLLARDESAAGPATGGRKPLLIALFAVAILVAALGLAYLVYRLALAPRAAPSPEAKPVAAQPAPAQPPAPATPAPAAPAPAPAAAAAPVAPAPAPAATPAKSAPPKAEAPKPAAGAWYKIKWGDTLWDLAFAYYRNPWYYPRIAKANKIKNPDLIISGTKIWIPKL